MGRHSGSLGTSPSKGILTQLLRDPLASVSRVDFSRGGCSSSRGLLLWAPTQCSHEPGPRIPAAEPGLCHPCFLHRACGQGSEVSPCRYPLVMNGAC